MIQAELFTSAKGQVIGVNAGYHERHLVGQIAGSRFTDQMWTVPASWASCQALRGVFGQNLQLGPQLTRWAKEERALRVDPANLLRDVLEVPEQHPVSVQKILDVLAEIEAGASRKLYKYQVADLVFLVLNRRALLGNEPGLGKTGVVIRTIQVMHALGMDPFPVVITCPNSLKSTVWANELEMWAPELAYTVVEGGAATRRKQIEDGTQVKIINWESLRLHTRLARFGQRELTDAEKAPKELNTLAPRFAVFDEAHKAKDPNAKQTRAAWALADGAAYKIAMTGTPVANNVADLWSILRLLDGNAFPAKTKFVERYAHVTLNAFGGTEVSGLRPDTKDEFFRVINPMLRRVPKSAALPQLPPKLPVQYRETPMSPKQKKAYDEMAASMLAWLETSEGGTELLTAAGVLAQLTRLCQFSAATAQLDADNNVTLAAPSSKVDDLIELLEEMGDKPLVVAAVSRQLIELAAERLAKEGISHGLITGAQTVAERTEAVDRFQSGKDRVILLTLGAGAEGLTLTKADTMLFMQRDWSAIKNAQAEDRIHRIGAEGHESITIIEQITPGTVEEHKLALLEQKQGRIQEVLRDADALRKLLGAKKGK